MRGHAFVGISGWDYPSWQGRFYPKALARRRWLEHACGAFDTIELNGTFYSLKTPAIFTRWRDAARAFAAPGFVFAVKGSRFITHTKKLEGVGAALANFYASGVLALEETTGPFLWQLPETLAFDPARLERFFALLPRNSTEAAALAATHDQRLDGRALVARPPRAREVRYRHALEPRHPSFFTNDAQALLRAHEVILVVADTAGRFPTAVPAARRTEAPFVYARLHGSTTLYASGYRDDELSRWAARIERWRCAGQDVYVYFDNDARGHAPGDALRLRALLAEPGEHRVSE